jgi:GNAT superfamily N-acetyltransferase
VADVRCERLRDLGAPELAVLVADSEQAGLRLVRRLVDEWRDGSNAFDRPGEAVFGARVDGRLVGVCGLNVDPYAGDERIGRVRHLYVLKATRRLGVARALMAEIIAAARGRFGTLRLSTTNPAAARLYESVGFRAIAGHHCTHVMTLEA